MIFLTALIVIGIIFIVFVLLAITRISLHIAYDEETVFSVSVLGFTLYSTKKKKSHKKPQVSPEEKSSKTDKKDNFFKKVYKKKGLKYTLNLSIELLKTLTDKLLWLLKRLEIRNFLLSLSVIGPDAAETAIRYGAVCSAVYPAVAFLDTNLNFKPKKIDIYADFESKDTKFKISTDINASLVTLVLLSVAVLKEFLKLKKRVEADFASTENNSIKDVL